MMKVGDTFSIGDMPVYAYRKWWQFWKPRRWEVGRVLRTFRVTDVVTGK